jgi:uncharacterized protein
MQQGVVTFEDLKEGMKVTGKIKNVVDFGAFVDLGIKETALLHISEMSDSYVADPMSAVKVGDVKECTIIALDPDRRRISLSLKKPRTDTNPREKEVSGTPKRVVARRDGEREKPRERYQGSDDGTKYNPFAGLLGK